MPGVVLISAFQARPLLDARAKGLDRAVSSLDLGVTKVDLNLTDEGVSGDGIAIGWRDIEKVSKDDRRAWIVSEDGLSPAQVYSEETGWVRVLCPTRSAPTVLVSGIPMHRIKDTDPMEDTKAKMRALGPLRGRILDTATGLGYTAIHAARTADEVVTIELDPAGIEIARLNPWSRELFERSNIRQIVGDAFEEVAELPSGSFSAVIHDPPTMSLGGELYSEEFYRRLHRILNRRGKLFHYIGDPDSGLGHRVYPGVMRRLSAAGFHQVRRNPEAYGLTASAS